MNSYLRAFCVGIIAGMRSMSAPAMTSHHLSQHPSLTLAASPLKGLGLPRTAQVLKLMALGELAVDKLPGVPNRTAPGPLGARAISGAVCGAAVFLADDQQAVTGAAIGGLAAIVSAFAFFTLRQRLVKATRIPDAALAAAEDALVFGIGHVAFA